MVSVGLGIFMAVIFFLLHRRLIELQRQCSSLEFDLIQEKKETETLRELQRDLKGKVRQREENEHILRERHGDLAIVLQDLRDDLEVLKEKVDTFKEPSPTVPNPTPPPTEEPSRSEAQEHGALASFGSSQLKEVQELLEAGESVMEIARKKGLQLGEVELIRSLTKVMSKDRA